MVKGWIVVGLALAAVGCGPAGLPRSEPLAAPRSPSAAPSPVVSTPLPAEPPAAPTESPVPPAGVALERYTVSVEEVPVKELLFTLARDASLNVDIHPAVDGRVTLNAVNQTLPAILERIARQVELRYQLKGETLIVEPDTPFLRAYRVDYVNISRVAGGSVSVATRISTTGGGTPGAQGASGGDNNSTTTVVNESANRFWERLEANLRALVGEAEGAAPSAVIVHRESGVVTVRASQRLHRAVAAHLDDVAAGAARQVLIEATVVEVELSDEFQAGVDWARLGGALGDSLTLSQELSAARLAAAPRLTATLDLTRRLDLTATLRMLESFGELRVLSKPRLMVMNNQTAMLKVVDNRVYFTLEVNEEINDAGVTTRRTFETTVHSVPVGFVMGVTPQIGAAGEVTLNVRPTLSRILRFVADPNPPLAAAGVASLVPEVQVRELESVLRVASGRTAVLGGLIQESRDAERDTAPGLASLPLIGGLFAFRDERLRRSELVIFLRPVVIGARGVG